MHNFQRLGSRGTFYILTGAFWFSLSSLCVKLAGRSLPFMEIVLGRTLFSLIICFCLIKKAGIPSLGKRKTFLLLRGGFGFVAMCCMFYSIIHMPLANAIVLFYMNPVFATILSFVFLKERLGLKGIACILISFVGVVLVVQPPVLFAGETSVQVICSLIALLAAFFAASAYVTIRKIGTSENPYVIVLYLYLVAIPFAAGISLFQWVWPSPTEWAFLIAIGIFAQIAQVNLTKGIALEPAGKATAMANIQIVFVSVWGLIFFGNFPNLLGIFGALCIVLSTIALSAQRAIVQHEQKRLSS
jgi:drug/metabolite transporter (DMT)-like permease